MAQRDEDQIEPSPERGPGGRARERIVIRRRLPGRRIDKYVQNRFSFLSRAAVQRLIRDGAILVNGQPTKASYEMAGGDVIDITLPTPPRTDIVPQDIPLKILHEDEHIIAVNKKAGIICHPAHAEQTGTLVNALAFHASTLSSGSEQYRPGIVHRLDKFTTGVILVAKTDEAHWRLALQFERRTVQKTYLAVVEGEVQLDSDVIDAPIGVHPVVREKFAVMVRQNKINISKSAVTTYEVAERFRGYSLVKLFPKTGRTHQLRVHMSHIGHPIVGDIMYGGMPVSEKSISGQGSDETFLRHQALHAWRIEFRHPISEHHMAIEAPFHKAMKFLVFLLRRWRNANAST